MSDIKRTIRRLTVRFTIIILALVALSIILFPQFVALGIRWLLVTAPPVTPPPPVITALQGTMPPGVVGLQEWSRDQVGADYVKIRSSGFLLKLPDGEVVGVTTAHSLFASNPDHIYAGLGLGPNGDAAVPLAGSDTYFGAPGKPVSGSNLAMDYVLFMLNDQNPEFALTPDPRGLAQPGERVTLCSGLGDGAGGPFLWEGTVYTVADNGIFILMDETNASPDGMSGSPVLSQHTGKVVGMVIAGVIWSRTRWLIGIHPIGNLVKLAEEATEFPKMVDFRR